MALLLDLILCRNKAWENMQGIKDKFHRLVKESKRILVFAILLGLVLQFGSAQATFQTIGVPKPGATFPFGFNDIVYIDIADDIQIPSGQLVLGNNGSLLDANGNLLLRNDGQGNLLVDNVKVIRLTDASSFNDPGQVVIRSSLGDFAGRIISALMFNGDLNGTILTGNQPNITSLGTLDSLTVNGNAVITGSIDVQGGSFSGNLNFDGNLNFNGNRITGLGNGINPQDAVTLSQMQAAIANGAGLNAFLAAGQATLSPEPVPATPSETGEFNSTSGVTFPVSGLNGNSLSSVCITNFTPKIEITLASNVVRSGVQTATGGTPGAPVALPGTDGNILFGLQDLGGGQYRLVFTRKANADPVYANQLDFQLDFFGTQ